MNSNFFAYKLHFVNYFPADNSVANAYSSNCTAEIYKKSTFNKNINSNNTCVAQTAYGSLINYNDRYVVESIPIHGTGISLNYSSNYNPTSVYSNKIKNESSITKISDGLVGRYAWEIEGLGVMPHIFNGQFTQTEFIWDQSAGLVSDNSFITFANLALTAKFYFEETKLISMNPLAWTIGESSIILDQKNIPVLKYKPAFLGISGWTVSDLHFFHETTKTLFMGTGDIVKYDDYKTVMMPEYGQVFLLIEKNEGKKVFIFNLQGMHLETRDTFLQVSDYKFKYNADNTIQKIIDGLGKEIVFSRNFSGKLEKIVSANGLESILEINSDNNLSQVITPSGHNYQMSFDNNKQLVSFMDTKSVKTIFVYNASGEIVSENKNNGLSQSFIENIVGLFKEQIHLVGQNQIDKFSISRNEVSISMQKYDSENELIYTQNNFFNDLKDTFSEIGHTRENSYAANPVWATDFMTTWFATNNISESGQNISEKSYEISADYYENRLNPLTKYVTTVNKNNGIVTPSYLYVNSLDRVVMNQDSTGSPSYLDYNTYGQITKLRPANQHPTDITYNADGKIIKKQKGTEWSIYGYDQYGYLNTESNSNNQMTTYLNDIEGKILEKTLPNGDKVKFEYTDGGTPSKITAPNNQVHYFQMSLGDFITNAITPNNKNTSFEYDVDKRITKITKPTGNEIVYNYKPQSANLQSITTPSGTLVINGIDARKRLRSITSTDQIKTEIDWAHTQVQEQRFFDTDGSLIGKVTNNFKSDELKINQIKINDQIIANYNFDSAGRVSAINQASYQYSNYNYTKSQTVNFNGMSATYAAEDSDSGNKPIQIISAQIKENPNLQLFMTMKRSFDTFGNATEFSQTTLNTQSGVYNNFYTLTPTYDANSRLIQIAKNRKSYINGQQINSTDFLNEYVYPQNSNNNVKEYNQRTTPSSNPIKRTIASHTNDDALTKLTGSINRDYVYNDDGDLKSMTNCHGVVNYDYDVFGNLKKVILADGKIIEYKVDGLNRRIKKSINGITKEYYLWYDQTHIAAILDENKIPKLTYIYGPESQISPSYVIKDGTTYKILHDPGLGSIRYIIDPQTQQIMQEVEYDENGNIMKNTNPEFQPILFSGGLYDFDTKLTRFGARDYDSTVGRWTTKDPIGFNGGDTNLYAYVGGNPMSYVDPSGLAAICQRPLSGTTTTYTGQPLDFLNLEFAHENIFYDDGGNVGFFDNGVRPDAKDKSNYTCKDKHYDDERLKQAVTKAKATNRFTGKSYNFIANNCQDFITNVLYFYNQSGGK